MRTFPELKAILDDPKVKFEDRTYIDAYNEMRELLKQKYQNKKVFLELNEAINEDDIISMIDLSEWNDTEDELIKSLLHIKLMSPYTSPIVTKQFKYRLDEDFSIG